MRTPRDSGECQNEMKMGEMLMSKNFTLEKAMSAMELMDPKMDSGMSDPPSKSLEETTFAYVFFLNSLLSLSLFLQKCEKIIQ